MTDQPVHVFVQIDGRDTRSGTLWPHSGRRGIPRPSNTTATISVTHAPTILTRRFRKSADGCRPRRA